MDDMIVFWTKTSGITGNSKMHLSRDEGNPFCGVNTYYFEFGGDVVDITKDSVATSYTKGTSVYQEKAYLTIPSGGVCKKCLKRALANES